MGFLLFLMNPVILVKIKKKGMIKKIKILKGSRLQTN